MRPATPSKLSLLTWSVVVVLGVAHPSLAQDTLRLDGAEGRMLEALLDRFKPLPSVERIWTGAFVAASEKSDALKGRLDSLQRSNMEESALLVQVGAIRQEMRTVRQDRNAFVSGFLSPVNQLALDSILNPPAPSIQHFGFHDRMKCLVCKDPRALDVPPGVPSPTLKQ